MCEPGIRKKYGGENERQLRTRFYQHVYRREFDQKSRKVAILAFLATSGNLPQVEWHIRGALENGLMNREEIKALIIQMTIYIGYPAAFSAMSVAGGVFAEFEQAA